MRNVLPTWQMLRTASMWRECGGEPFEVPPHTFWPDMIRTLRFIRDRVRPVVGPVEAVSGYRNPALNACARGSGRSAHLDYFALDLIPVQPMTRRQLFERVCPMHARYGPAAEAGLGFYTFLRFHIDTRSFRRWGSAGPAGNESPCASRARRRPEAPPLPPPVMVPCKDHPRPRRPCRPPQPQPTPPLSQFLPYGGGTSRRLVEGLAPGSSSRLGPRCIAFSRNFGGLERDSGALPAPPRASRGPSRGRATESKYALKLPRFTYLFDMLN